LEVLLTTPTFSDDVRPVTDLKTGSAAILNHVRATRRPVLLTRRGRGVAVLLDLEEYEQLVDRARFIDAASEGLRAIAAGDTHGNDEAMAILDGFGE
jgi:prevent-host-death family protein